MSENKERKEEFTLKQFQRNRYFYGKLMTVRDFELEQDYFNEKRYLLNKFTCGKGLLCGFYSLELKAEDSDEVSVRFEDGGVALDSMGREIVVPKGEEKTIMAENKSPSENRSPFKRVEFKSTTYLYLRYRIFYSEFVSAASNPLSCEEITCPNRILEDFEVIASSEYPVENEDVCGPSLCTPFTETDDKVFFVAVNEDLSINEDESNTRKHYLQTRRQETVTRSSATGVVYFEPHTVNSVISDFIDPKLGKGSIFIQLGLEREDGQILAGYFGSGKNGGYSKFQLESILDPRSGKFRVQVVFADESERSSLKVRWWASRADIPCEKVEVKSEVSLTKYKFVSDPEVKVKIVENGLCVSGSKNCMKSGVIVGGDHYARIGNDVALNGNPKKLAELIKEQDEEPKNMFSEWEIGGGWLLKVDNFDSTLKRPVVKIRLYFEKEEVKSFNVSKGDLVTYCEDIEGETGVPLFVTYIDDIYIPIVKSLIGKEAKVVLKYTWAISKNVRYQD